tara:strand:+ start:8851 stop:9051 length:201 start_codon:yes stop_codon:yes gene_type:complete
MNDNYYNCDIAKKKIDTLLHENAKLRASLGTDSTIEDNRVVDEKINYLMSCIKEIDPKFHDLINLS